MTVYEYAKANNLLGEEITCYDTVYDTFFYFYPDDPDLYEDDAFFVGMRLLERLLEVVSVNEDGDLMLNVSECIERSLPEIKKAFPDSMMDVNNLMHDWHPIMSGYVSEQTMIKLALAMVMGTWNKSCGFVKEA